MRILHLIADLDRASGGPAAAVLGMAEAVARRGHEVEIMTTDYVRAGSKPLEVLPDSSVTVRRYRVVPPSFLKPSFGLWADLRRRIDRFDLVHVHSLYLFHCWLGPRLCRRHAIPYIVRPHGSLDPIIWQRRRWRKHIVEQLFETINLARCAAVHFTHPHEQRDACLGGWNASFVCPLGVDHDAFSVQPRPDDIAAFRDRHGLAPGDKNVLFLGRLTRRKGAHLALVAGRQLGPGINLLLAGRDQEDLAVNTPGVRWLGQLDDEERRLALAVADLLIAPSAYDNFGLSVLEAMAAGVPPLVSSAVALADEIREHDAGWVVDLDGPRAVDELAAAIIRAIDEREPKARNAAHLARSFDWRRIGELLEHHYREIVAS